MKARNFVAKHAGRNRAATHKSRKGKGSYNRQAFKRGS